MSAAGAGQTRRIGAIARPDTDPAPTINSSTIGPGARRDGTPWRAGTVPFSRSLDYPAPTVDTKAGHAWKVRPGGR